MDWENLYGAYIEYENHGIYSYRRVIVGDWHEVMAELDSFVKESTESFIYSFCDRINYSMEGNLGDHFEKFKYLNEEMSPCEAIELVVKNEIKRNHYEEGTLYTSRSHYQFLRWALGDVWDEEKSWFRIQFECPLPDFITKWHSYVKESCKCFPRILPNEADVLQKHKNFSQEYELLGRLSLFLDVDAKRFPEYLKGFFALVGDFNDNNC